MLRAWTRTGGSGEKSSISGAQPSGKPYRAWRADWEHDHCAFCWRKLVEEGTPSDDPETQTQGYAALGRGPQGEDDYHWVCDKCFADFRDRFGWTVVESQG
jgi:hypothetical protein